MTIRHFFHAYMDRHQQGIEIAPWFNPLAPKAQGYKCLSLDIWDRGTLIERAKASPHIPPASIPLIEEVDLIGTASDLGDLATGYGLSGNVDYVVGSHVIEHIPDPIRFFHGVEQVLRPGGSLLLAVPDVRACFDYFRPHSTTADMLAAYAEKRQRPTSHQIFGQASHDARHGDAIAFSLTSPAEEVRCIATLEEAYAAFLAAEENPSGDYVDAHCWVFVPASFELIIRDLAQLGVIGLSVDFITDPVGCEFYVRLIKVPADRMPDEAFKDMRNRLLHAIHRQLATRWRTEDGMTEREGIAAPAGLTAQEEFDLISQSAFFDANHYRSAYPDVAAANVDPVLHYVLFGWKEGRNPHPQFNTTYYLGTNPDVARGGGNPLVHYLLHGNAQGRAGAPKDAAPLNMLDLYAHGAPSDQQTADIFAGKWLSALPGVRSGTYPLFDDDRVKWGCGTLGGVKGQRVLELGPMEGAHTHSLIRRMGASSVVAVEANSQAYLKCLVLKEIHGLNEAKFLYGDCIAYLESGSEKFDLIFSSGILYHMREPLRLLSAIAARTDRLVLSTHYYDADMIARDEAVKGRLSPAPPTTFGNLSCAAWRYDYGIALDSPLYCGGSAAFPHWIEKSSILDALRKLGFTRLEQNHDQMSANGPLFTVAAARS